jgi:alpha-1,3-mannosyl-glycoprotein beta-1,2-N-acetylglucosaminyltransferase
MRVIILEEDLQIAPDFYEYFGSLKTMLDNDSSLLCISAFNDNGFINSVKDNKFLYRSDFFPGLGWMLTKKLWDEYSLIWPKAYWDDWLREPERRKGRHIIRPEVSRTYHYGRKGVSNSEFGSFLDNIKLNSEYIKFSNIDLSYLQLDNWDSTYINAVKNSPIVTIDNFNNNYKEVRILYSRLEGGTDSFVHIAHWAGVMDNIKAGVPRTAYKGVVSTWKDDVKIHIAPIQTFGKI